MKFLILFLFSTHLLWAKNENCVCVSLQGNGHLIASHWAGMAGFFANDPEAQKNNLVPCGVIGGSSASISAMLLTAIVENPKVKTLPKEKKRKVIARMLQALQPVVRRTATKFVKRNLVTGSSKTLNTGTLLKSWAKGERALTWNVERKHFQTRDSKLNMGVIVNVMGHVADYLHSPEFADYTTKCVDAGADFSRYAIGKSLDGKTKKSGGGIISRITDKIGETGSRVTSRFTGRLDCSLDAVKDNSSEYLSEKGRFKTSATSDFPDKYIGEFSDMKVGIATGLVTGKDAKKIGTKDFNGTSLKNVKFGFMGMDSVNKNRLQGKLGCSSDYVKKLVPMGKEVTFRKALEISISEPNIAGPKDCPKSTTVNSLKGCATIAGWSSPIGSAVLKSMGPKKCGRILSVSRSGATSTFINDVVNGVSSAGKDASDKFSYKHFGVGPDNINQGKDCNLNATDFSICNDDTAEGKEELFFATTANGSNDITCRGSQNIQAGRKKSGQK